LEDGTRWNKKDALKKKKKQEKGEGTGAPQEK